MRHGRANTGQLEGRSDAGDSTSRYSMTPSWALGLRRRNEDANQFRPPSRYVERRRVGGILATVECKILLPRGDWLRRNTECRAPRAWWPTPGGAHPQLDRQGCCGPHRRHISAPTSRRATPPAGQGIVRPDTKRKKKTRAGPGGPKRVTKEKDQGGRTCM